MGDFTDAPVIVEATDLLLLAAAVCLLEIPDAAADEVVAMVAVPTVVGPIFFTDRLSAVMEPLKSASEETDIHTSYTYS